MSVDPSRLLSLGCANRTCAFASAAVYALISIYNILAVLFDDALGGAGLCARTASEALICIDNVCHCIIPPIT